VDWGATGELAEGAALDLEAAGFAALELESGSGAAVPCWFWGDAAFSTVRVR
jgi:hypothetical protein